MRNLLCGLVMALGVGACGGDDVDSSDPGKACNQLSAITCDQIFRCATEAEITALGYSSNADCVTKQEAQNNCSTTFCDADQTFDEDNANDCIEQMTSATCEQVMSGGDDEYAPSCDSVCDDIN